MTAELSADPGLRLQRVAVLGANGTVGAGAAALFATGGCHVTLVARDLPRAERALAAVQGITKSERVAGAVALATYPDGLAGALAEADLVFEAIAEDAALKRELLASVDAVRRPETLVATATAGLSIRTLAVGRGDGFRAHFAGIRLSNPPALLAGTEVIPHPDMPRPLAARLRQVLAEQFGRQAIICADTPGFAANRIAFKVTNEVARLAEQHGVQMMDTLVGPYTGRALAPLATIDLVGWDVHKATVDQIVAGVQDEGHASFELPAYMEPLIRLGHLGDKTPPTGGFYRRVPPASPEGRPSVEVLDPASGGYRPLDKAPAIPFVLQARDLNHRGRYRQAIDVFMEAEGPEADIARRVVLGYVSYALGRVGEVVESAQDVDRIMAAAYNWAPPTALVDLIGLERALRLLDRYELPAPALLQAARRGEAPSPLYDLPGVSPGQFMGG